MANRNTIFPDFQGLVLQRDSKSSVAVEGLATVSANYVGKIADIEALNLATGAQHPNYVFVGVENFEITNRRDDWGLLEIAYKGVFAFAQPRWNIRRAEATIPVEQASDWATEATPDNGAQFDPETGIFTGWKSGTKYAGRYTLPTSCQVVTKTSVTASPDTSGTIGAPESPGAPFATDQLYFSGAESDQQGGIVWRNVKTWKTKPTAKLADFDTGVGGGGDGGGGDGGGS